LSLTQERCDEISRHSATDSGSSAIASLTRRRARSRSSLRFFLCAGAGPLPRGFRASINPVTVQPDPLVPATRDAPPRRYPGTARRVAHRRNSRPAKPSASRRPHASSARCCSDLNAPLFHRTSRRCPVRSTSTGSDACGAVKQARLRRHYRLFGNAAAQGPSDAGNRPRYLPDESRWTRGRSAQPSTYSATLPMASAY
jgi:hypothetical protein